MARKYFPGIRIGNFPDAISILIYPVRAEHFRKEGVVWGESISIAGIIRAT